MSALDSDTDARPLIDRMAPEELETAIFALNDIRDAEARLGFTRGVWGTCVGYAETRRGLTRAVKIYYSPDTVNYAQLLELLLGWYGGASGNSNNETGIFFQTEQERRLACAAISRSAFCGTMSSIFVRPFKSFQRAENASQKYYLRLTSWLYEELMMLYRTEDDLLSSTLAARLNGFLRSPSLSALYCMPESTELYGLSTEDLDALRALAN